MNTEIFGIFGDRAAFDRVLDSVERVEAAGRSAGSGRSHGAGPSAGSRRSVSTGRSAGGVDRTTDGTGDAVGGISRTVVGADRGDGDRGFHAIVEGDRVTVGIRDDALGLPGRTSRREGADGFAVVWGEAFPPDSAEGSAAEWLYEAYRERGTGAFDGLNGSYIAVVELNDSPMVVTDAIRSWECFTAWTDAGLVFGSDAMTVAQTIPEPAIDPQGFAEFLYLGGALNTNTLLEGLDRLPLDHALTPTGLQPLGRYRHDPESFDYTAELARRLERAIARRTNGPGVCGVLLSAGFDSRALLECDPSIDVGYTLGRRDSDEVAVAAALAARYGVDHTALEVDDRYLDRDARAIRATNGVKESLHIHHAAYTDEIAVDAISHGLLFDTLLRGYFVPWDSHDVFGLTVPRDRLDPDPDPVRHLSGILGYLPGTADLVPRTPHLDASTPEAFLESSIGAAYETCRNAARDGYAAYERFGVQNVLSTPFRTHLADQFRESHVAADAELVDWHLRTPPAERTDATFRDALRRIDPDLLTPRPPDRPYDSLLANQVAKRLRLSVPGLQPFENPWPDRRATYDAAGLDEYILPDRPDLHDYPPRFKLRIRDLRAWLAAATGGAVDVDAYLPSAR